MEKIGASLVLEGSDAFIAGFNAANKAAAEFVSTISSASGGVSGFGSTLNGLQSSVKGFASSAGDMSKSQSDLGKSGQEAASGQNIFKSAVSGVTSVIGGIGGAVGSAVKGFGEFAASAGGAAVKGLEALGGAVKEAVTKLVDLGVKAVETGAKMATGFVKSSITAFGEFNDKLNEVNAVAEVTPAEMKAMRDEAIKLGADLPVSATQAAEGFTELAKAGFNANEVIAAGPGLATLAVAGQLDMGSSAAILSGAIRGFGLDASDANHVVDLLAKTANASSVDVKDLGVSFKYVAPVAHAAGFSIEDMSVALGIMGNNMIKGSQAGTSLRSIITGLTAPTDKGAAAMKELGLNVTDSAGNIRPFNSLIGDLRVKFKDLSQEQQIQAAKTIFGKEAMSGFLAIVNASDSDFNSMTDSINNANGAGLTMANTMMKSMKGAIENMKGSVEAFQIKVGEIFAPLVVLGANTVASLANKFGDLTDKLATHGKAASASFMTGFSLGTSGSMADIVGQMQKPTSELTVIGFQLAEAFKPLVTTFHELMVAISPVSDSSDRLGKSTSETTHRLTEFHPVIAMIGSVVSNVLVPAMKTGFDAFTSFRAGIKGIDTNQLSGAGKVFNDIGLAVSGAVKEFGPLVKTLFDVYMAVSPVRLVFETLIGFLQGGAGGALDAFEEGLTRIGAVFGINLVPALNIFNTVVLPALIAGFNTVASFVQTTLLPAFGTIGDFINSVVLPAFISFGNWLITNIGPIFSSIGSTLQTTVIPALASLGEFIITTVIPAVQSLAIWIGQNVVPVLESLAGFIASTVVPIVGQLAAIFIGQVLPAFFQVGQAIASFLAPLLERLGNFITSVVVPALTQIGAFIQANVLPALSQMWSFISANIMPILITLAGFLGNTLGVAFDVLGTTITVVWNVVTTAIKIAWDIISGVFGLIVGFLSATLAPAFTVFQYVAEKVWRMISGVIDAAWGIISGIFNQISGAVSGPLTSVFQTVKSVIGVVWDGISGVITIAWNVISGIFTTIATAISGPLTSAFTTVQTTATNVWNSITKAIGDAVDTIGKSFDTAINFFADFPGNALKALGDVGSFFINAGSELIGGLVKGIQSIHIPFPHFNVTMGSVNVAGIDVPMPNFDVKWYAKGGIFNSPALMSGLGDNGPEAALPLNETTLTPYFVAALEKALPMVDRQISQPASYMQMMSSQSTYNYQNTKQINVDLTSMQSSDSILSDLSILEAML